MWGLPESARVVEVGLRDGLQAVAEPLPLDTKLGIVEDLIDAGVREIEVCSFAHPKVLPQLADAEELLARVPRDPQVRYRGLAPNLRGAQRAAECELDEITVVIPAEDGMALKNQGRRTEELLADLPAIGEVARGAGQELVVAVACAFFSPSYGEVSRESRHRVVAAAVEAGATGVYLATTTGQEHPRELYDGIRAAQRAFPGLSVGAHLHNRNGFAPANALAALSAGADWLETSFAGLGGDMWFPGDPTVLGNMSTEDLVHLLAGMGIRTGIDLEKVRAIAERVYAVTGFPRSSFVSRGGTRADLAAAEWPD
ncbi:hydroxymethylglutaryl-CoA lyase [Ornithinimicrobium pratense]|uniref:Hydroxymethylglutaryl-CoA lyase n=1 Tax=Ornithinimicrobium pratense TaxID=2593973 RepID=A0A5J6V8N7_9MICO|nr:hydroxymethylglutaryl-CoA lyase [Ornithinimicrobium pratense]QFG70175.1 hydroxymethylglutaryl-CoA lyase [Ornithinimicrobium pratense]